MTAQRLSGCTHTLAVGAMLGAILSGTAGPATAQAASARWVRVDRRPDLVVYVDSWRVDSLGPALFQVWIRWELTAPKPGPDGKLVDLFITQTQLDCRRTAMSDVETSYYLGETLQLVIPIREALREWTTPPPQTVGETVTMRGCLIARRQPTEEVR